MDSSFWAVFFFVCLFLNQLLWFSEVWQIPISSCIHQFWVPELIHIVRQYHSTAVMLREQYRKHSSKNISFPVPSIGDWSRETPAWVLQHQPETCPIQVESLERFKLPNYELFTAYAQIAMFSSLVIWSNSGYFQQMSHCWFPAKLQFLLQTMKVPIFLYNMLQMIIKHIQKSGFGLSYSQKYLSHFMWKFLLLRQYLTKGRKKNLSKNSNLL